MTIHRAPIPRPAPPAPPVAPSFADGERVVHARFGTGEVVGTSRCGARERVRVRFPDGERVLLSQVLTRP